MTSDKNETFVWWKYGVVYHIYPQSFKDTNGDGIGDLQGIIEKLDYLSELGVDAIWLSPIYESPLVDAGYDISDYKSINQRYGTFDDFKLLLEQAHKRDIKVIMDLVLNHTSNQHEWFLESKSSKDNPKRNWYIWSPPKKKKKRPNNWRTNFGQAAWTFDSQTEEYYYHSFFKVQPDLNWRNPAVKLEMFKIIAFWLNLGVDGFRLDVINMLFKHKDMCKNSITQFFSNRKAYNRNQPEIHEFLKDFRSLLDKYPNRASVGEIYTPPPGDSALVSSFVGNGKNKLHLAFDFSLIFSRWGANHYYKAINNYYNSLSKEGWSCFVMSNHDLGRHIRRFPFGLHKYKKAKIVAVLLLTLKGTPFIYYGDEIGMENLNIPHKYICDMYGKLFYPFYKGRDMARTPMQWSNQKHAGFSDIEPWLPIHPMYGKINVDTETLDTKSIFSLYKKLILIRKKYPVLQKGDLQFIDNSKAGILSYRRFYNEEEVFVFLNFSFIKKKVIHEGIKDYAPILAIQGNYSLPDNNTLLLPPFEGVVFLKLKS